MARSLRWATPAWQDLEETADFIARDSPSYASTFVEQIRRAARSLPAQPLRGRVVPELGSPSIRELLLGSYRLIYEVQSAGVTVLGLIHGSRDLAALWEREERPK